MKSILVALTGMLFSCANEEAEINAFTSDLPEDLITQYHNINLIYSDSAKIQMKIDANELKQFGGEDSRSEFYGDVVMKFYDEEENLMTTLKANKVIRREEIKEMQAFDNVILINQSGETLNTEHLIYNEGDDQISTEEMVKITRKDEVLWGEGMVSNATFTKYSIKKIKSQIPI